MESYFSFNPATGVLTGIEGYDIVKNGIVVYFKSGDAYLYTDRSAGKSIIDIMIRKAQIQSALNRFINEEDPGYVEKWNWMNQPGYIPQQSWFKNALDRLLMR